MSHSDHSDPEKLAVDEKEVQSPLQLEHTTIQAVGNAKIANVHNAAFAAATADTLNPWSRQSLFLFWCMFVAFLCSCANGYDGSLMTGINGMPFYLKMIGSDRLSSGTSLVFSMYTVGGILGPWFAGPVSDRWGRRMGMFVGGLFICLGTAIIASSHGHQQFVGGRFVLGFGIAFMTTAAPSYCVEICPPQWRGRMTGFYNCGWFGGSIPAAGVVLGTQGIQSDLSWRIPLIIQCVPSLVVICSVWFLPESPRWLMANGYDDKARDFLTTYHGNNNPNHPMVELEWVEFKENIALDGSDKRWYDYSELFNTSSARWRSLMVILMGVFGQFSGNGLGYFNTEIYASLGYDQYHQFVLNLGNSFASAFGAGCGVALADKMPRRQALVWGTLGSAAMLAGNGGLSARWAHMPEGNKNLSVGQGGVAFYFLFNIIYSFTYTPLQALYPVECLQTTARAKGMAMYAVIVGLVGFINTYAGPIALKNIKYNYIFIFVAWDCVEALLWYLLGVETVGRTLEELEEIFGSKSPVATSKQKRTVAIKQDGRVAVIEQ